MVLRSLYSDSRFVCICLHSSPSQLSASTCMRSPSTRASSLYGSLPRRSLQAFSFARTREAEDIIILSSSPSLYATGDGGTGIDLVCPSGPAVSPSRFRFVPTGSCPYPLPMGCWGIGRRTGVARWCHGLHRRRRQATVCLAPSGVRTLSSSKEERRSHFCRHGTPHGWRNRLYLAHLLLKQRQDSCRFHLCTAPVTLPLTLLARVPAIHLLQLREELHSFLLITVDPRIPSCIRHLQSEQSSIPQ